MSTAQLERTSDGKVVASRVAQLRHTSPGRLMLIVSGLVALSLLTGLLSGLATYSAASGTSDLGDRAQPLLIEAETIYSALADADATAAQAFLAGGLEPVGLTRQYEDDLKRATEALTSAARRVPDDSDAARSITTLASGITQYGALVGAARANNRQGLPIGASYLARASALNQGELQGQAQALFRSAQDEVDAGYDRARRTVVTLLAVLLLMGLLGALVGAQRYLSRTTRRTFNLPLVGATAIVAVFLALSGFVLAAQRGHLSTADTEGSRPVALLSEARILALRERGMEALDLAARGSTTQYAEEFDTYAKRLGQPNGLLAAAARSVEDPEGRRTIDAAIAQQQDYLSRHEQADELNKAGNYDGAVKLVIGPETADSFTRLTGDIGTVLDQRKELFTDEIDHAGRGLGVVTVLGPLAALAVCALVLLGFRPRLEEYR